MKAIKNHQKTWQKFRESFLLKMATKFLLPVSVFSVIVSYSSLLPFLLHFFNFSYSAYSKQLFGYNIDKNCMFLLFNGILVFIFKNSGVINKSPEETDFIAKSSIKNRNFQQEVVKSSEMEEAIVERKVVMEAEEEVQDSENVLSVAQDDVEKEQESSEMEEAIVEKKVVVEAEEEVQDSENVLSVAQDDVEKEQENKSLIINEEEEEEEEEEGIGLLSKEELNKKCDDFIRKMKLGIKFGTQQLIMV